MGNYKDARLESLSNKGDGNYGYIDSYSEAKKLFIQRLQGTLFTIARDVKIQVEFNPRFVNAYRLLGYENRLLNDRDFEDDTIDAGDIGSGHTVTAFYEIVPTGVELPDQPGDIKLKYQHSTLSNEEAAQKELLTLKLRYKWLDDKTSRLIESTAIDRNRRFDQASRDFKFATAVAGTGLLLRNSPHKGDFSFSKAINIAKANLGKDQWNARKEFVEMIETLVW